MPSVLRLALGLLLLICGTVGAILPVLGVWMVPLGLLVLSFEFRWARRGYLMIVLTLRQRSAARLRKMKKKRNEKKPTSSE